MVSKQRLRKCSGWRIKSLETLICLCTLCFWFLFCAFSRETKAVRGSKIDYKNWLILDNFFTQDTSLVSILLNNIKQTFLIFSDLSSYFKQKGLIHYIRGSKGSNVFKDLLIERFTPYRQYFSHVTAATIVISLEFWCLLAAHRSLIFIEIQWNGVLRAKYLWHWVPFNVHTINVLLSVNEKQM